MDDVDHLFACFKCGISPPESAIRERKKEKRKLKRELPLQLLASSDKCNQTPKELVNSRRHGKQFSPVVFYGSPHAVPPKRPIHWLRLLHEIRADQNKLREELWNTFPRQDEAIKFAKSNADARVFSYQDHVNGMRRFLVSTYKEFWLRYKNMNPQFRHHYEVIQEGLPCHLYFDLEFNMKENSGRNGDEMVDLLLAVIFDALLEKFSLHANLDMVVELDSSTEEKFSRHVIIRLPKSAFKNNSHAGAFVSEICSRIYSYKERDEKYHKLFVSKGSSSPDGPHLFVDTAVYSRNRCFRLFLSSKAGKRSTLVPSRRYKCNDMSEEQMFMSSLICNLDDDCEKLLICKMDIDCVKALHFETETTSVSQTYSGLLKTLDPNVFTSSASATYLMGKSPFPALDDFVEATASYGNSSGCDIVKNIPVQGKFEAGTGSQNMDCWFTVCLEIDSVSELAGNTKAIMVFVLNSTVIYVIDLRRMAYYQKCHDPDCRGYRSPLRPIPDEIVPDSISFSCAKDTADQVNTDSASDETVLVDGKKEERLEATKMAEQVETLQNAVDLTHMDDENEEDETWWMVVEDTASVMELALLSE